jgi:hypothetical protein
MATTETASTRAESCPRGSANTGALSPKAAKAGIIGCSEFKFLIFFTLALCAVTSLPYLAGHLVSFPGTVFTDVIVHSFDTNNYLAYANQAASGSWLFRNPMTAEPHRAVFFNLEWLAIGKLAFLLHLRLAAATNVIRLLSVALICIGVYWLSSFLFCSIFVRRVALVAALAGGGFGWLATLHLFHIPIDSSLFIDLSNANLFPFFWALKLPHFLVSESFVILGLCMFLFAERRRRASDYLATGFCYMVAGACRPYDMLFLMAATALYLALWCLKNRELRGGVALRSLALHSLALRALPVLMCIPLLGYYYWIFKIHPIFRWWSLPGNPAPAPWLLALGFAVTILLLPFSAWRLFRQGVDDAGGFVLSCLVTAILFSYTHHLLHFSFQFATNILVPLVMIVLLGLEKSITTWRTKWPWATAAIIALLAVNSFTSIALTGQAVLLAARGDFRADAQLLDSFAWLRTRARDSDVILADLDNSNQIPQYTRAVVFCGYDNAVHFDAKEKALQRFLDPKTPNELRRQLTQENAIRFVLLTSAEEREIKTLGQATFLHEVFRNNAAVIFSVAAPAQTTSSS